MRREGGAANKRKKRKKKKKESVHLECPSPPRWNGHYMFWLSSMDNGVVAIIQICALSEGVETTRRNNILSIQLIHFDVLPK